MPKGGEADGPELVRRREQKKTAFVAGRTIGEKRERLETKRERAAAREKDKRKKRVRIILVSLGFIVLITILIVLIRTFLNHASEPAATIEPEPETVFIASIPIEDASSSNAKITSRMQTYIGMLEADLKTYGYQPTKAVLPIDGIREVDIYLEGRSGYLKTTIDRGSGVTTEDADRMLRYLEGQGITDFEYIDVRIDGRAFWK